MIEIVNILSTNKLLTKNGDLLFIYNNNLTDLFQNATSLLKTYVSLLITVASSEESFYNFKLQQSSNNHQYAKNVCRICQ